MPLDPSPIGALTLPVPAGVANQRIEDPIVDGLLAYLGHWLNDGLNARLALHSGLDRPAGTHCTASPATKRFPFDPTDPQAEKFRVDPPCLFLWWHGESEVSNDPFCPSTIIYTIHKRQLRLLWLLPELPSTAQHILRAGIMGTADALMRQASIRKRHRTFSYTDAAGHTWPTGTPITECLGPVGTVDFRYIGGAASRWGLNQKDPLSDVPGDTKRDWPCLVGLFHVYEKDSLTQFLDPADVTTEITVNFAGTSEGTDTIPIMDRYLDAPDGSELEEGDVEDP